MIRRKYIACLFLAVFLWAACALDLLGMYESRAAMAGIAPIYRGYTGAPNIALMFNVDWGEEHLGKILNILAEKSVVATFFPTGSWAEKNAELAGRMVRDGHEIGNHGAVHSHVETMARESLQRLIQSGEERLFLASGARPSKLFAPPYGEWTDATVNYASEMGYLTVMWTVDTVDWRLPPPETIWKRALAGAVNGALVLLHPTEPTVSALPLIIDGLRDKGFELTTVSTCITGRQGP
ncbi:MAG: polysaccharide deacetylase family protein [Bacillota bacterium]